jgi:hypothetical protein
MDWTDIVAWSGGPVVGFAAEELRKYALESGVSLGVASEIREGAIILAMVDDVAGLEQFNERERAEFAGWNGDGFAILPKDENLYIIGANDRSVLFGVYQFCKDVFGFRWVTIEDGEHSMKNAEIVASFHSPKLKRRGFVFETINEPEFMLKMVDWLAKQYINEIFFTFYLWNDLQVVLEEEIKKRGMSVTLGGHSMASLLNRVSSPGHAQLDFSDETWQNVVIERIVEYCGEGSAVSRVSLWPEDTGVEDNGLLKGYMKFTERIKEELPHLEVEHIAYNAGLSWQMLELGENQAASGTVDTLYAFWGRNYHKPVNDHARAHAALEVWRNETGKAGRKLTIFEYYSDHFMLSDLFPPLFTRISADVEDYAELGVEGLTNLVVPYKPKKNGLAGKYDELYPWRAVQQMNGYFFSRLCWGDRLEDAEADFFSIYGEKEDRVREWMARLESTLSQASGWNIPLFPSRLMDPEQIKTEEFTRDVLTHIATMKEEIETIKAEAGLGSIEEWLKKHDPAATPWNAYETLSFYIHFLHVKLEEYEQKWKTVQ